MIGATGALLEVARHGAGPGPQAVTRRGYAADVPRGGATRTNQAGDWPTGDRRTSCYHWRAAYKSCPPLSMSLDVIARTVTAGGIVVTADDDAAQVFADDPENRPQDGEDGSTFDRDRREASHPGKAAETVAGDVVVTEAVLQARRATRTDDRGQTARDEQAATNTTDGPDPYDAGDLEDNRPQADRRTPGAPPREPVPPPGVQELRALLAFCNPAEDMRKLSRRVVLDCLNYGDSFTEVSWLLGKPVALWSLDSPSMTIECDEHGKVSRYVQDLGDGRRAEFAPHEVIHVPLDSVDSSIYGWPLTAKVSLEVEVWLYTTALLRQKMKLGDPPTVHVHFGLETTDTAIRQWIDEYMSSTIGIDNLGTPVATIGTDPGSKPITELKTRQHADLLAIRKSARDGVISGCGVTPSKVGVIESGNLGGGTGGDQDRTFHVNTCGPVASTIMEVWNYALLPAFDIEGWSMSFEDMDWRDDKALEEIRDMRLRAGAWTLNRYLADIGEPLVDPAYGDVHAILPHTPAEAQLWNDLPAMSGLIVDQARQAAQPKPTPGVPSVDASGNPVPPGHPSQVPPGHPAAVKAVQDDKAAKSEQLQASLTAAAAASGAPAGGKGKQQTTEAAGPTVTDLDMVRAHALAALEQARTRAGHLDEEQDAA